MRLRSDGESCFNYLRWHFRDVTTADYDYVSATYGSGLWLRMNPSHEYQLGTTWWLH